MGVRGRRFTGAPDLIGDLMKKLFLFLFLLLFPLNLFAKINVVATLPIFGNLAEEIGGDRVLVTSLARGNQDPHFLDAKPSYAVALNKADLLVHGGLDLEVGWLPPVLNQARNGKILSGTPGNVNLSQGLQILEIPKVLLDRSMGDVHPLGNPHTWLEPNNVKLMVANIYQHLIQVDPQGKDYYLNRFQNFLQRMNSKLLQWDVQIKNFRNKEVITYHKSFSYFANWTGLKIIAMIEPKPGIPPSSSRVSDILKMLPNYKVKAILVENFYPKKIPQYLSEKTKIPMLDLPTDTGEEGLNTYFDLMDHLIGEINKIL